ncbi:MAG TPA: site-specific DNA-methyltransferase [Candidatus Paceibacterota bacterium]|nr:site-specific DNA-methyltransferase [Candidatus Paceibacterota bacterium]
MNKKFQLIHGNSKEVLSNFPDNIFQCCVTSPPYFQLRDYFVEDQLGQEKTPEEYINNLVDICREVKRVLRKDGVFWLNLGDSYNSTSGYSRSKKEFYRKGREGGSANKKSFKHPTIKTKDLVGMPWMVAFALRDDGWYLRTDCIYSKSNSMPDGAKDRPTRSHEYIFQLTKSSKYFYDYFAVLEKAKSPRVLSGSGFGARNQKGTFRMDQEREFVDYGTRNKRSVWECPVASFKGQHFAVFSTELIDPCIRSSVSGKGCCSTCGSPWKRILEKIKISADNKDGYISELKSVGWEPTCKCGIEETIPCLVLDPFNGTGTTGLSAFANNSNYVGVDLNGKYLNITRERLDSDIFVKEVNNLI